MTKKHIALVAVIALVVAAVVVKDHFDTKERDRKALFQKAVAAECDIVKSSVDEAVKIIASGHDFAFIKEVTLRTQLEANDMVDGSAYTTKRYAYLVRSAASLILLSSYSSEDAKIHLEVECRRQVEAALAKENAK
ncbi:hypothetical protein [Serratia nevei]|uniref:hypothetical protein n=1 Tax=Serratia nevei TaxID=2703794 RepID=UPI00313DE4EC